MFTKPLLELHIFSIMKSKIRADVRWNCPFAGIISGPSRSGKTTFIFNMLKRRKELFDSVPTRIVYVYGIWQKAFENKPHIEFIWGIDKILDGTIDFNENENNMLILDDVMEEVSNNKKASTLFTRDMHHKNVTVWFVLQNLYKQGRSMRDIMLNCQIMILFRSPRDVSQVSLLGKQTGIKGLKTAYEQAIKEPYGYLVINLQPQTDDRLVFHSELFAKHRAVYIPK